MPTAGGTLRAPVAIISILLAAAVLAWAPVAGADDRREPWLRLASPHAHQVVQRDASGGAVITVRGRCSGLRGRLRVTWGGQSTAVLPRRDGRFTARLRVDRPGQDTLRVVSNGVPFLVVERRLVGVGDVYVVAGQSNASGRGPNLTVATHPEFVAGLFGNDYRWKGLVDPVDSPAGQVDRVSADYWAGGSVWPLLATHLMAAEAVPVAFIPCARGNTTMSRWLEDPARPRSRRTLYGSLLHRVRAAGGRVRAVLLLQGESDARREVPAKVFERQLRRFAADLAADVGAPVVVGQGPDFAVTRYPPASVDAIRDVQVRADSLGPNLRLGPSLYDIDLGGAWHIALPDDQALAARRWAASVLRAVLGRVVVAPPRLVSAAYDGALDLELGFSGGPLAPGPVEGFSVEVAGRPAAVVAGEVTGDAAVRLVLAEPLGAGEVTVSLGLGRAGAGAAVPTESSPWRQPVPTVLRWPVVRP
jgi:hypothetical protein